MLVLTRRVSSLLLASLVLVGLVVAACANSGSGARASGGSSCGAVVRFGGTTLDGVALDLAQLERLPPKAGRYDVVEPGCEQAEPDRPLVAAGFRGVNPRVALVAEDNETLYLGRGYLTALRDHPLHRVFWRSSRLPDYTPNNRRCPAWRATGVVGAVLGGDRFRLRRPRGSTVVRVEAATRVAPPAVAGEPRLRRGQRVRVSGVRCGSALPVAKRVRVL